MDLPVMHTPRMLPTSIPERVHLAIGQEKDDYCFICDDGGQIIICDTCPRACCYDMMPDPTLVPSIDELNQDGDEGIHSGQDHPACVTIPKELLEEYSVFQCPECLSTSPSSNIKYIINRGSRNTRWMGSRATVVLVIYYLRSLQRLAEATLDQISAILGAFQVEVISHLRKLPQKMKDDGVYEILSIKESHHLAVLIMTESDPLGGWWWSDRGDRLGKFQDSEAAVLSSFTEMLHPVAKRAKSARIFGVMCGTNLSNPNVVKDLYQYMSTVDCWNSLTLPCADSIMPADYVTILPDLFVQLYYYGIVFESALLRVWAKSRQVRVHTGLLTMERTQHQTELEVRKFLFAPEKTSPLGVVFPLPQSVCGCWDVPGEWQWVYQHNRFEELFVYMRSTCCQVELQVAVFTGARRTIKVHGTTIAVERWDKVHERFPFNRYEMVVMRTSRKRSKEERGKAGHNGPWTKAGLQALASDS